MSAPSIYVFDAFGTLFDVHSAARACAPLIGEGWPRLSEIWRCKQLEYAFVHAALDRHVPFREVTRQSLVYALTCCGQDQGLAPRILEEYSRLEPFADVKATLEALKARGDRLAILSNGDIDMLDDLVDNSGTRILFDVLISVATLGTFKPSPKVYALATEYFGVSPEAITFLSSNRWDIAGAAAFGFKAIWVNRASSPGEYLDLPPARVIAELSDLV